MDALRGASSMDPAGRGQEEDAGGDDQCGSVELSFKNKGTAKTQAPSSSANPVGAKICRRRMSWSWGSRDRRRDLQRKSQSEVVLLRQDPPTLKSVLCLNKNGALEQRI